MVSAKRRAPLLVALTIGGMFLAFAGDGIGAYFTPDDMMNLYVSWSATPVGLILNDRPLGALVYRLMFLSFGLNPLPYRIVCFVLLVANLVLLYQFCRRLSGSREIGALACLLGAYHAHLADLYYSTGTIYDLLCCLFFLLAFNFYLEGREGPLPYGRGSDRDGRGFESDGAIRAARVSERISWKQTAALLALYVCALASKEMAVVLPVYVAFYEGRRAVRSRFLWLAVPLTAAYAVWKVAGPHAMTANPAYAVHFSLHLFLAGWKAYLNDLFYGAIAFSTMKLVLLWIAITAFAVVMRRRDVWIAWCIVIFGVLPFIFIAPRGFFVMYLVLPGWYLLGASALVALREQLARWSEAIAVRPEQLALFVVLVLLLIPLHRSEKPLGKAWVAGAHQQIRTMLGVLQARFPTMPHGSRVLFLSDPYDPDDWILTSTFRLQYRDQELHVDRVKANPALAEKAGEYAHVFTLGQNKMEVVR